MYFNQVKLEKYFNLFLFYFREESKIALYYLLLLFLLFTAQKTKKLETTYGFQFLRQNNLNSSSNIN